MSKDFLTYNQQMKHLRDDKNIDCHDSKAKQILIRNGYFNLINGYKMPFVQSIDKSGKHTYIGGTSIEHLYNVKQFDEELKLHLLKYITKVEEEIRTLTGYKFDQVNNNGKTEWYRVEAYDPNASIQSVMKTISDAYQEIEKSRQTYVKHYLEQHKFIPTWILTKTINFSTMISFIENSKYKVKDDLCELYGLKLDAGGYNHQLLISSLHWFRIIRNSCAHNERVYGIERADKRVNTDIYLKELPKSYSRDGDQKIMDLIIYMRYYLPDREYEKFVKEIKRLLTDLKGQINVTAFNKIRGAMGIKDLSHLDILVAKKGKINYNSF